MSRRTIFPMLGLLAIALVAQPALAGKPSAAPLTGTIDLAAPARVAADVTWPRYGDVVGFATSVSGSVAAKSMVYVNVVCLQGGTVVYQASAPQGATFDLVDQAGQGLEWDAAADCIGSLVYRVDKGQTTTIAYLDQESFGVAG